MPDSYDSVAGETAVAAFDSVANSGIVIAIIVIIKNVDIIFLIIPPVRNSSFAK